MAKKFFQIFFQPAKSIETAAAILAASILISRLLGLVRYRLLAAEFGDEIILLDSFIAASNIPEIIFEVLIFGSITVAFIPVFSSLLAKEKIRQAWELTRTLVNLGFVLFIVLALILIIGANNFAILIAPGLISQNPEVVVTIGNLIRVMVFAQIFFLLGIFATGVLQSYQHFLIPAIAPAIYNLGIIFGIVTLSPIFGIYGPAFGMVIGAAAFFIIQFILSAKFGSMFGVRLNIFQPEVAEIARLAGPRMAGLAAARGIDWINIALTSLFGAGAIVGFNFAQNLIAVPVGLFGASIAQAVLPTLSTQFAKKEIENFKKTFISSLHQIFFLCLPAVSLLAILRIPAIRLVFGAANFPWETTLLAGKILIVLSPVILAQASLLLLVRTFYALHDPKTPIFAGLASFGINLILALIFIPILKFPITFLAASFTFSNIFYAATLLYFLDKKVGGLNFSNLVIPTIKMLTAAILSSLMVYLLFKTLDALLDTSRTINVLILTLISGSLGLSAYFAFNLIFGVHQAKRLSNFFKSLKFPQKVLTTETFKG